MMGGAVVSGIFGAIVGLLLADQSHSVNAATGAIFGFLLGVCAGVIVGATVQVVDDWIKELLNSIDSRR
jgi:gas vesicle protein